MTDPRTGAADVVRSVYAAFSRGDAAAVLAPVAADCDWQCLAPAAVPFAGRFRGPAGVQEFLGRVLGSLRLEAFEPHTFLADGATVVVLGRDRGTSVTTGKPYATDWVHVWTVEDGRVTAFREYFDPAVAAAFTE